MPRRGYAAQVRRGQSIDVLYRNTDDLGTWLDMLRSLGYTIEATYEHIVPLGREQGVD